MVKENPWVWLLWTVGALGIVAGLLMVLTADGGNPYISGPSRGDLQAARGWTIVQWGGLVSLGAGIVTALLWKPPASDAATPSAESD